MLRAMQSQLEAQHARTLEAQLQREASTHQRILEQALAQRDEEQQKVDRVDPARFRGENDGFGRDIAGQSVAETLPFLDLPLRCWMRRCGRKSLTTSSALK